MIDSADKISHIIIIHNTSYIDRDSQDDEIIILFKKLIHSNVKNDDTLYTTKQQPLIIKTKIQK
jgi:hypothetical protein